MRHRFKKYITKFGYGLLRGQASWSHPRSPEISHARILPYCSYAPWINDAEFQAAYLAVKAYTLLDIYRLYELWLLARQFNSAEGDFLEVGVWRGGSGCLLALASNTAKGCDRHIFLADTFSGVVKAGVYDTDYRGGEHADTSEELVHGLLSRCAVTERVTVLRGMFPEATAEYVSHRKFALIHIDVDVFESAQDVLLWAVPRLVPGGVVVFDDYGFYGCEGITRMVNEFTSRNVDFRFIHNLNGHGVLIKLG